MRIIRALLLSLLTIGTASADPIGEAELWQQLRSGQAFAMIRHALAPGIGDPDHFVLDDCRTQRNLSDSGREQSKQIGEAFRQNGITRARVFSSQWCRCLETANLLGLGPVTPLPALNSFFDNSGMGKAQTAEIRRWLRSEGTGPAPLIMVTHQVNITALTDVFPASGEMLVLRRGEANEFAVTGTIAIEP